MVNPDLQRIALTVADHKSISVQTKVSLLNFIADFKYPLDTRSKLMLEMLRVSVENWILPPKHVTLQLLSCHFSILMDKELTCPQEIVFRITPLSEEAFYDANNIELIRRIASNLSTTKLGISILIETGFGNAEVSWYHPHEKLLSIKYLHESGGYCVASWEHINKLYHMARVTGF